MNTSYLHFEPSGFPQVRIESEAGKLMGVLDSLVNYDDGQGRRYDILDDEINDTTYHYNE